MSKRSAEAEIADGIPDEPQEKTAKLDNTNDETPLLEADEEALKQDEAILGDTAQENGQEPIVNEPDEEEGEAQEDEAEEPQGDDEAAVPDDEGIAEDEANGGDDEDGKEGEGELSPNALPDDVKDVEFKVPPLPSKAAETAGTAIKANDEETAALTPA